MDRIRDIAPEAMVPVKGRGDSSARPRAQGFRRRRVRTMPEVRESRYVRVGASRGGLVQSIWARQ